MNQLERIAGDKEQPWPGRLKVYASDRGSTPEQARKWCESAMPAGAVIVAESHHSFYDRIAFRVCAEQFAIVDPGSPMPIVYQDETK